MQDLESILRQPERLAAIDAGDLRVAGAIPALDHVVRAAARLLGAPICQLNVVTDSAQVPVSHVGPEGWGGPVALDRSYCRYVVGSGEPLVISDARTDPLVEASPVTRELGIGSYLSVPIVSPRAASPIATLCVVDFRPRAWSDEEIATLRDLADWARSEIELRVAGARTQRRMADALRQTDARLRAIYDGTYGAIGLLSPEGTVLDANRASLELAGGAREDVVGLPIWETSWFRTPPAAREALRRAVARAATGEFVRCELPLGLPTGRTLTFDFSVHPVKDEGGRVVFLVPEWRDVTERQEAVIALRESEARYRALFDSMDAGYCVVELCFDDDGRPADYLFVEANPAFELQSGLTGAMGLRASQLVPSGDDQLAKRVEIYGRVAATGEPARFETYLGATDRWFDVFAFRSGDLGEHRVGVLFRDITAARAHTAERDRLLAALEVERARLFQVFRRAPGFMVAYRGPDQVYEFVNEAYSQLVGRRELIGKPLLEALPEVRGQGFKELLDHVRETGEPWVGRETPVLLQRTPGAAPETRYLDMVLQALTEVDGTRSGVVAHGSDVTDQVLARREVDRLLEESEQARADAEAANRGKSDFLATMSHELRTPLNAIAGYVELIQLGIRGPVTGEQHDDLRRIQQSQRHLLGLINEVLNYAKLETGSVGFQLDRVCVADALHAAGSLVAPQARARELALEVGECPPHLAVRADAEKLRQILVNLLGNAVKFTDPGGRVELRCRPLRDAIHVEVADDGIGIPPEKLVSIFDPFVQVRSDLTRLHEGTGLGLAISRDLARGMGGDLVVESVPGVGSTFTLTLPAA